MVTKHEFEIIFEKQKQKQKQKQTENSLQDKPLIYIEQNLTRETVYIKTIVQTDGE